MKQALKHHNAEMTAEVRIDSDTFDKLSAFSACEVETPANNASIGEQYGTRVMLSWEQVETALRCSGILTCNQTLVGLKLLPTGLYLTIGY